MPDSDHGLPLSVSALHRARIVIAALLLMLHWAAPSLRPFDPLPSLDDSAPAYSKALNSAVTGTLPRTLARIQSLDPGLAKPGRQFWPASGPAAALPPERFDLAAPPAPALPDIVAATRPTPQRARDSWARAPPVA